MHSVTKEIIKSRVLQAYLQVKRSRDGSEIFIPMVVLGIKSMTLFDVNQS